LIFDIFTLIEDKQSYSALKKTLKVIKILLHFSIENQRVAIALTISLFLGSFFAFDEF